MKFLGHNFNVVNPPLHGHSINGLIKSLVPGMGEHFFCADNLITWNRNLSFLQNKDFVEIVQRNSNTDVERAIIWRTYILCYFAKFAKRLEGDFVEVGAYEGNTANIVIEDAKLQESGKKYFLYDAFEHTGTEENHSLPAHSPELYAKVKQRFEKYEFVNVIKGYVPDSFALGFPQKIAFAHVDLNQATAEVAALERILPILVPGGVIILDDYGWWAYHQQKQAEDPLFARYGLEVLELPTGQGLVLNNF
jgi:O-methyltransferase